ncbi:MAG: flagellar hook-associated protein FlgK [Lachnospiraceae bacterium]|nr:flagellar hook-associated protein FlgK [Lachnospiraceae bacterium]
MPSTFFGLNIATSGMSAYNAVLNTTAHNIANVKTPGYSKQTAAQSAKEALSLGSSFGMIGSGVEINSIENSRDEYYDYKFRKSSTTLGYYDAATYYMQSIEDSMYAKDSGSGGVSNTLDKFFASLTNLTTDPTDKTIRAEAGGYADSLAEYAYEMATNLQQMQGDINTQIATTVSQINSYARQIASLTKQINTLEVFGGKANDLRDQRAQLLDELSMYADIDVTEKEPADGNGMAQYVVTLGGGILVDTYATHEIKVTASDTKDNQCDAAGLYKLSWEGGEDFAMRNTKLGGRLQALLELRDGNNSENFKATIKEFSEVDAAYGNKSTVTLTTDKLSSMNASDLAKLSIPESKGILKIGNYEFEYDSFDVKVALDGTYTYTFVLKEDLSSVDADNIESVMNYDPTGRVGDAVPYRGIPYYMSQINEFLRTFSANFNQIQNKGYDMNGNFGKDLFVAKDITTSEQLDMNEFLRNTSDGYYYLNGSKVLSSEMKDEYIESLEKADSSKTYTTKEVDGEENFYNIIDNDGNVLEKIFMPPKDKEDSIFSFSSTTTVGEKTSYYSITAMLFTANKEIVNDGTLLACASRDLQKESGVSEGGNLNLLVGLQSDVYMFKQGKPSSFLQVMTATVGVDSSRVSSSAENAKNIVDAVDNRRLSTAGVDEDEEAQNLIITQNLLNAQYKVISVMNEVLDKLINSTGV